MRTPPERSRAFKYLASAALACMVIVLACGEGIVSGTTTPVPSIAGAPGTPQTPAPGGGNRLQLVTLLIATSPDLSTIDPALAMTNPDVYLAQSIYENLVSRDPDGTLRPLLAESWQPNADRTQWTFKLRSGVLFHHGKEFTAEDVVSTFKRLLDPATGSPALPVLDIIEDVVAVDPLTVRFDLSGPSSLLPDLVSIPHAKIVASDKPPDDRTATAPGTGPFSIEHHSAGSRTVLKRFDDYWGEDQPKLSQLTFLSTPTLKTRISGLVAGQVHVVLPIEASEAKKLENRGSVVVLKVPASSYVSISMDVTSAPFDNKLVRQALRAAIDRAALVEEVLGGDATVANDHPIAPSDPLYWAGQEVATYDIDAAKALLKEAGFADGVDITLHTSAVTPAMAAIAAAIKKMAEPAGFRIEIEEAGERDYVADIWLSESFATATWSQRLPDEAMALMYRSDSIWNTSNYSNSDLDDLIKLARTQLDEAERKATYQQIQQILIDDVPTIIPVFMPMFATLLNAVEDLEFHPFNWVIVNNAFLLK
jgi:peptide/nickel transport system substrate-binding protein